MRFELYVAARYLRAKRRQAVVGVVTAISVTVEDVVGIFTVATLQPHRQRGYGAAVTARDG